MAQAPDIDIRVGFTPEELDSSRSTLEEAIAREFALMTEQRRQLGREAQVAAFVEMLRQPEVQAVLEETIRRVAYEMRPRPRR